MEVAGTLFAALYGELRLRELGDQDAFGFFISRSSAMGWLDEPHESGLTGLWGMNDAEATHAPNGNGTSPVAWFQVTQLDPIAGMPIPTQPFFRCIGDTIDRTGNLRLDTLGCLLPVQTLGSPGRGDAWPRLIRDAGWFADNSAETVPLRITVDSGPDASFPALATGILDLMRLLHQPVAAFDSLSYQDGAPVPLAQFDVLEGNWDASQSNTVTFFCTITEWSLKLLGWLMAYLAETSYEHGFRNPLLITLARAR